MIKEVCFHSQVMVQSKWISQFDNIPNRGLGTFNRVLNAIVASVLPNLPEELKRYLSFRLKHIVAMHGPWFNSSLFREFLQAELASGYGISEDKSEKVYTLMLDTVIKSKFYYGIPESLGSDSNWCHFCLFLYTFDPDLFETSRGLGMGSTLSHSMQKALAENQPKKREFMGQAESKLYKLVFEIQSHQAKCSWYLDKFWLSYLVALNKPRLYSILTQKFLDDLLCLLGHIALDDKVEKAALIQSLDAHLRKAGFLSEFEPVDLLNFFLQVDLIFESNGHIFLTQDGKKLSSNFMAENFAKEFAEQFQTLPDVYQVALLKTDFTADPKDLWSLRSQVKPSSVNAFLDSLMKIMPEVEFGISMQQWLLESQTAKVVRTKIIEWIGLHNFESVCSDTLSQFNLNSKERENGASA